MFATKVVEKIKTHISCSVTSFSPESRAVSENVGKFGRPRLSIDDSTSIIRFMRIACWMTETRIHTHTHVVLNTYCFSTATVVTRTRLCYVMRTLPVLSANKTVFVNIFVSLPAL